MKNWCYKWLPIICGCHRKSERSFHFHSEPFPVCARCTGELLGMAVALITAFFYRPPALAAAIIMVPMVVDGLVQHFTSYESNNLKRVVTGFLFGWGLVMLFVLSGIAVFRAGMRVGASFIN